MPLLEKVRKSFKRASGDYCGLQLSQADDSDIKLSGKELEDELVDVFKKTTTVRFLNSTLTKRFLEALCKAVETAGAERMVSAIHFIDCQHAEPIPYLVIEQTLLPLVSKANLDFLWEFNGSKKERMVFAKGENLVIDFNTTVDFLVAPLFEEIQEDSLAFKEVTINVVSTTATTFKKIVDTLKSDSDLHLVLCGNDARARYPKNIKPINSVLGKLTIANITINSDTVDEIAEFIIKAKGLQTLNLVNVRFIKEEDLNKLLVAVSASATIENLTLQNIQGIRLKTPGFLVKNKIFKKFIVKGCDVSDSYQKHMVSILFRGLNLTLTEFSIDTPLLPELRLALSCNRHPDKFTFIDRIIFLNRVVEILHMLQKINSIDFVGLNDKNVDGRAVRSRWVQLFANVYDHETLYQTLGQFVSQYYDIYVTTQPYPALQKYVNLFKQRIERKAFEGIELEGVTLSANNVADLVNVINSTKNLKLLTLINISFELRDDLNKIFVAIANNPTIEVLVLRNIYGAMLTTVDFVMFNTALKKLVIQGCATSTNYQKQLASRLIKFNSTLAELEMDFALVPELVAVLNYNRSPGKFSASERTVFFMQLMQIFRSLEKISPKVLSPGHSKTNAVTAYRAWVRNFTSVNCYVDLRKVLSDFIDRNGENPKMSQYLVEFRERLAVVAHEENSLPVTNSSAPTTPTSATRDLQAHAKFQWETGANSLGSNVLNTQEQVRRQILQRQQQQQTETAQISSSMNDMYSPVTSMGATLLQRSTGSCPSSPSSAAAVFAQRTVYDDMAAWTDQVLTYIDSLPSQEELQRIANPPQYVSEEAEHDPQPGMAPKL